jgi:hypothetical protein
MLNRFTRTAEREAALASGVPLGRIGEPAEIARAIVFVATEGASFVTGQILTVDGRRQADHTGLSAPAHRQMGRTQHPLYAYLEAFMQPTIMVNGGKDVMIQPINSFLLQQQIPNA